MPDLRTFTLWARAKLTNEAQELLLQIYGLQDNGQFLQEKKLPILARVADARETRTRLEKLFADEEDAGVPRADAYQKLVKEIAFTHLNRLVALKLLEGRKLIRGAVDRHQDSNAFKMYLAGHEKDLKLFEQGSMPQDDFSEGPSDQAYRHYLLWQYDELAKEIRVLFDSENLASRLFPRPRILKELIEALNASDLKEAWAAGNEETIGWVYQFFNAEEKDAAFERVFKRKQKFHKTDIPAATQIFTPRWVVKFLVQNSLGRLWISMHPDSELATTMEYLVPPVGERPVVSRKSVKEIKILDPATGTMHFGLVAFDLLLTMYSEELASIGKEGWPTKPPVTRDEEIPAAILANNLFGIDIDLRAVQLAALALYLRAKSHSRTTLLSDNNLACADVTLFRGPHRSKIAAEMSLPRGLTRELFSQFCDSLDEASLMGSLVRVEKLFQEKIRADELKASIDAYVRKKADEGIDESYFGGETAKGLRMLDVLMRHYDVVFTNPPYMSSHNMNSGMSDFMKRNYKKSKGDLYAAFIERCAELLADGGRVAMITQQSFMFISSFEDLRALLLGNTVIETMAHVGPRTFADVQGEKVNTTAYVLRREGFKSARQQAAGVYLRLVKEPDAEAKRLGFEQALERRKSDQSDPRVYVCRQEKFFAIPGSPWVYWITDSLRNLFITLPKLESVADPKIGMRTGDNGRFIRFWWEPGLSRIGRCLADAETAAKTGLNWFPYMKGGGFRRWYGNQDYVVPWKNNGAEIKENTRQNYPQLGDNLGWKISNETCYFRRGITYSYLTGGTFCARLSPGGFIFDVAGSSLFPKDVSLVLAVLNSSFALYALKLINPTVNFQVGDVARLPVPNRVSDRSRDLVDRAIALAKVDSEEEETTYDFIAPPLWVGGAAAVDERHRQLNEIEREIDEEVFRLYEISQDDRRAIELELSSAPDTSEDLEHDERGSEPEQEPSTELNLIPEELAARWLSYAVGVALGRFRPGVSGAVGRGKFEPPVATRLRDLTAPDAFMVLEEGHPLDLARSVLEVLNLLYGDAETERVVRIATRGNGSLRQAIEGYLLGTFFKDHVKRYRKRPVYWLLQSPNRGYSVYFFHERATENTLSLLQGRKYLGGRIHRVETDLQNAKKMEAGTTDRDKTGWTKKARDLAELLDDLRAFDQRITAANNFSITNRDGRPQIVRWQPEFDDGVLLNAAPLHELTPAWKRVDAKLDLTKAWKDMEKGEYNWSRTAMRYWPQHVLKDCQQNKSFAIAQGLV